LRRPPLPPARGLSDPCNEFSDRVECDYPLLAVSRNGAVTSTGAIGVRTAARIAALHLWAEQFDTPRADPSRTQHAIVAHLVNRLDLQLQQALAPTLSLLTIS
jgi:hypothetical protein